MPQFEIKHRYTGAVLYAGGGETLRDVVVAAVKAGAYLGGADLGGADLVGDRPALQIGPIGSRSDVLLAFLTDAGVRVHAGCFRGSLDEFRAAAANTHGDNGHAREYTVAITLIEAHAQLWTPAPEPAETQEAA